MSLRTRDLVDLHNTGHPGINSLFSKAHSMDWDLDRDVDWSLDVREDDPCIDTQWATLGRTPTFQALPEEIRNHVTRRELVNMLHTLQIGESVAQDVCAKLALICEQEDYRNHAVAQAMDEARHHMAYVRFLEKMGDDVEPLDAFTEGMFDNLLASDDPTTLIATEQFFLESLAMRIFDSLAEMATHPLLRDIVTLIRRDESRHMGFGVLYVTEHMKSLGPDGRLAFARQWLPRIVEMLDQRAADRTRARVAGRLRNAGVADPDGLAARMVEEQGDVRERTREDAISGKKVPHLLRSCRGAGLLEPEILEALGLQEHPLIRGALRALPLTA